MPINSTHANQAAATLQPDDIMQLRQRVQADERGLRQSLQGMAALLGDQHAQQNVAGGHARNLLSATLAHVLQAMGAPAVFKPTDPELDTLQTLEELARQASVSMRQVRTIGQRWWQADAGPLLAFLKDGEVPVALLPLPSGGYRAEELESGRQWVLKDENAAQLSDIAWMFFRQFPPKAMSLRDLLRFGMVGTGRDSLMAIAAGVLGALLGLATPYATGLLVDKVIPDARSSELLQLVLLLVAGAFGAAAFEISRSISLLRIEFRLGSATEAAIIHRLMHLPVPFFRQYAAGDLAQRAFAINQILQLLTNTTQSAVFSWFFGLISFGYMYWLSWQLGLVATALVLLVLSVTLVVNIWRLRIERLMYDVQGDIASRVLQILSGIAKLRNGGAESRAFALWARDFTREKTLSMRVRSIGNGLTVFNAVFMVLASAVLYGFVAFFKKDISTGDFVAFNSSFSQFLSATLALASALTVSLNIIPLFERARPILEALPEQTEERTQAARLQGEVILNQVSFRYTENDPLVLDNVSISVKPGEFIAFVGPSGSGKSTLFRLLLGFETPERGAIYYDQQDLASLDPGSVRRQLGVVLQNGRLMPGDIFTNIVGSSPRTLDEAWEAARMAGLEDDILAMPMGMHTVIAEGASTISGGQRQRLMIARALVNRPSVLLFDEATSALDNQTQALVSHSVAGLNATRIVIAHRLSSIQQADRIYVLVGGKVLESGNYEELMALNGHFAEQAKRQQV